jgi:GNAT superfamily N-acetyltransferase
MTLFLRKIEKKEWILYLKNIGLDRKWLLSIYQERNNDFYSFGYYSSSDNLTTVGACYFLQLESGTDCSFFILPEYRRKGFAKKFITEITPKFDYIQFTISKYNKPSISLFESIPFLKMTMVNEKNRTLIFQK